MFSVKLLVYLLHLYGKKSVTAFTSCIFWVILLAAASRGRYWKILSEIFLWTWKFLFKLSLYFWVWCFSFRFLCASLDFYVTCTHCTFGKICLFVNLHYIHKQAEVLDCITTKDKQQIKLAWLCTKVWRSCSQQLKPTNDTLCLISINQSINLYISHKLLCKKIHWKG